MQKSIFFFTLLLLLGSCDPDPALNLDPLPPNIIQVDGVAWEVGSTCALLRTGGSPAWYDMMIQIEGVDGTSIYLSLPGRFFEGATAKPGTFVLQSIDPYIEVATATYYSSTAINSSVFKADRTKSEGTIELVSIDSINHTITLRMDVSIYDKDGNKLSIRSGDLQQISYKGRFGSATSVELSVNRNEMPFLIAEGGYDMVEARVDWFMYDKSLYYGLNFYIPWNAKLGEYQLSSADRNLIQYKEGTTQIEYLLDSGQFDIEAIDFCTATIRGRFQAKFKHPDDPTNIVEFTDGVFEAGFE